MNTLTRPNNNHNLVMQAAVALAVITGLTYLLMAFNVLGVGNLQMDEKPAVIIVVSWKKASK